MLYPNGTLIESKPVAMPTSIRNIMRRSLSSQDFHAFENVQMYAITYWSNGLRIKGYLALPPANPLHSYPALIFNRGGAGVRGALSDEGAFMYAGLYASWGYVCIASNYRGQGGSEGIEEWGSGDVDDARATIETLRQLGYVQMDKVGLIGGSRGGMMAYMMLRTESMFRAAVTIGAPTILDKINEHAYIRKTFKTFLPQGASISDELSKRSVASWTDEICKTTPLLVLHGTGDRRVLPEHSLSLAFELQRTLHPYRLIMYENADHILAGRREESNNDIRWWVDTYVRDGASLPKVGPHGA